MSRSPERDRGDRIRRGSMDSRSPDLEEAPAKKMRVDAKVEDKARSKRLFGNLLGTLQQFKKDDKTSRTSEAAKRREQVSERIQNKIRSETTLHHEISETDKELKTLRITTDSAEYVLKHKEIAMTARHASLRPTSRFLYTSLPPPAPPIFEGNLLNPSPIPLNQGPAREPPLPNQLKPLYFLPKILLPEQETELNSRIANIDELITDEIAGLIKEKDDTTALVKANREKITELASRLRELRSKVRPSDSGDRPRRGRTVSGRDETDELGRTRRRGGSEDRGRDGDVEMEDGDGPTGEEREREAGVQIRGEDGDVEVEY